jgi:hypothetical protein
MDPELGGPKTCGSGGLVSGTMKIMMILFKKNSVYPDP